MPAEIKPVVAIADSLEKLDIRLGKVLQAVLETDAPKPSYKLTVDFGKYGQKTSVARLTSHSVEEIEGALVFGVLNFEPRLVGSTLSEVLVLGVQIKKAESGEATFLTPASDNVKLGSKLF